jgi:Xaa-Pro aminopeptidase
MHTSRPVFVDLADRSDLRRTAEDWQPRIDVNTAETDQRPADALLIRPDAHIAWATTVDEPTDTRRARAATSALGLVRNARSDQLWKIGWKLSSTTRIG